MTMTRQVYRMETLKRRLPTSGHEGLQELAQIAVRFEEKIYTAATSQPDYLRKISSKMLTMEMKSQNPMANSLPSNPASNSKNPQDQATQSMQSQMQNQVQKLPFPIVSNQSQAQQQLLSQNIQNNIASTGVPSSTGLASSIPPVGVGNSMGQVLPSNMYANSQRQIQVRQQRVVNQEQQQWSQNPQKYLYNQQLQHPHHLMKQKFQQGGVPQSIMQSKLQQQQQQQNLLQPNQLQSSQQAVMQPSVKQTSTSSTLQNPQSSLQQSTQSMLQQQSQSVLRQQQQQTQQPSIMNPQQTSMPQHQMLPTQPQQQQQQQQLTGQQPNTDKMQQNQLMAQPNSILDVQQHQRQQRMITQQNNMSNLQQQQTISQQNNLSNMHQQQSTGQQNNLPNMHQQQLGSQPNLSGFQQQQMVGIQHGNSSLQTNQQPVHMLQQSKVAVQQQMQQNMGNMLPNQAQQPESQPRQQQLMSQIQSQPGQLQQQLGLQQQAALQRDMQQRIQTSGPLLQQQTTIDQQKQLMQSQRVMPEVPLPSSDSSSQTGNASGGDWQEEIYQKIKSMNELYFPDLNDMYQRMAGKLQQHDALHQQPKNEQLEKIRLVKVMLERLIMFLRTTKNDIEPSHKEKAVGFEKQIVQILNSNRPRKPVSSLQQGQLPQPHMHVVQQSQQQQPQISQMHTNEDQVNNQIQPMNVQGSVVTTQQNNMTNLQYNSLSSISTVSNTRQIMLDALKPSSNVDPGQGNALNQMQQVAMSSLQQNPVSGPQQMNIKSISPQSGLTTPPSNVHSLQTNSNILQPQQIKQEQQMFSTQQLKQQYQQRQMQQQYLHRQHLIQQQPQRQTTQQQSVQLPTQQVIQLNQMNDANDMKMRHQMGAKSGLLQPHNSSSQRPSYHLQQMKSGTPFSMSSQQVLRAASPQIGHHASPQIEHQNLLSSHTKAGTPLQSANSPFIVPLPSTSMAPSPMPGDSEKTNSVVSSLANAGNSVHHPSTATSVPNQSLAIGTPGISASPLLAESTSPDGTHGVAPIVSGNSNYVEQPLERLIKVVKSMTPKALSASVSDISSVVSMVDRIAGSAPGNGSRAAIGEDLVGMTKCRLQARNYFTQAGPTGTKKMRRCTTAMSSNVFSSTGSVSNGLRHLNGNESDGESTGASSIKKPRIEANHALAEELREINQRLIDTIVYISEDDVDPAAAAEGGEGISVKCSFSAIALSPNLKSKYASAQMSPIQPLRLLIPNNYPNSSPILLDKFPIEVSKEYEDLSIKAKSRFSISLRTLAQPMSLGEVARTWDNCARSVISEYVQQSGGGSFSSNYGTWENCLSAA